MSRLSGNNISYQGLHSWLNVNYGKAYKCEMFGCDSMDVKRYDWALKKGKLYERKRENFWMLCRSCHTKYDFTEEKNRKLSIAKTNNPKRSKRVAQFKGKIFVQEYPSIREAQRRTGVSNGGICETCQGKKAKFGGFIWRYA